MNRRKSSGRRKGGPAALAAGAILLVIAVSACLIFFRVRTVTVVGNAVYSDEEILRAAAIREGSAMVLVRGSAVSAKMVGLEYVEAVQVRKSLPDEIVLTVTEASPTACCFTGGRWWLVDEKCRYMREAEIPDTEGLVQLQGMRFERAQSTQRVCEEALAEKLSDVLSAVRTSALREKFTVLDVSEPEMLLLEYDGRLTVRIGGGSGSREKLRLMEQVLTKLEPDAAGILDLTVDGEARYLPSETQNTVSGE